MLKSFSIITVALALLAPSASLGQQATPRASSQQQPSEPTFRVQVKLVNIFATVTDQDGRPVGGLKKDDFRVFEDDNPQQIAVFDRESALPLSIVLALDTSLSTKKDLPLELESARKFAHTIIRPVDGIALFQFSEVVNEIQPFTNDIRRLDRAISQVKPGGATALYDAVYLGSQALIEREGRKVMVVITDGGDTVSRTSYKEAVRAAQIADTIVYSIIMVPIEASAGRDLGGEHALIQLSNDTGGKYFYATSINQLEGAFQQISDELRTQYLIAYYPPKKAFSDYRSIRLEIAPRIEREGQFKVRARSGYFTSKLE